MLFEVETRKTPPEIDKSLREAAERHKFGVLSVIDLKQKMQEKGIEHDQECSVYEVCNPQQAKNALDASGAVSTALPCRISVYGSNGSYRIATLRPTELMKGFEAPGLAEVAQKVEEDLLAMIRESA